MAIATLRGRLAGEEGGKIIVEASGIGYEVAVPGAVLSQLKSQAGEVFLHIAPVFGMYGGGETLYGFLSAEQKAMFLALKDHVPGTGAKKALEYLDKALKSLPDFRRAVLDKDAGVLRAMFGFGPKAADKLLSGLKDVLGTLKISGSEKLKREARPEGALSKALGALSALGYKNTEARSALEAVFEDNPGADLGTEDLVRFALKKL